MPEVVVTAQAPSNIALVKYMGKKDASRNIPENSSLSMTLSGLSSLAEISVAPSNGAAPQTSADPETCALTWIPELPRGAGPEWSVPDLDSKACEKIQRHFARVQGAIHKLFNKWEIAVGAAQGAQGTQSGRGAQLFLRTANNFPPASGIASSASSFAAMTLAMAAIFAKDRQQFEQVFSQELGFKRALAQLSRMGSGSSCRSFEGPWVYWKDEDASRVPAENMPEMAHFVILISRAAKKVGSSEAHSRVNTSPLWLERPQRAEERSLQLRQFLHDGNIPKVAELAWREAWEMHSLFHTAAQPFTYWEPATLAGLQWLAPFVTSAKPPIVTLDAGPNIHILVEKSSRQEWQKRLQEGFPGYTILEDQQGTGARLWPATRSEGL